jgi:hypothetical protein
MRARVAGATGLTVLARRVTSGTPALGWVRQSFAECCCGWRSADASFRGIPDAPPCPAFAGVTALADTGQNKSPPVTDHDGEQDVRGICIFRHLSRTRGILLVNCLVLQPQIPACRGSRLRRTVLEGRGVRAIVSYSTRTVPQLRRGHRLGR